MSRDRLPRYALLTLVLGAVAWLALGRGSNSFEAYCPFGGVESLWGLFREGEFSCTLAPLNLSMLLGVLGLTLLAKKAFCGWVCPVGFLGELLSRAGGLLWRRRPAVPPAMDARARLLRYAVLALALAFTYKTGELVLRGFDPYFLVFSGFGHGSAGLLSAAVLALTALGALLVPMMFCRYLCPLGAALDPFSRAGLVRLERDERACTSCGLCSAACPQGLAVDSMKSMTHRDCTNCLECAAACPQAGALRLAAAGRTLRPARAVLAALAVLALTGGYHLRAAFTQPTTSVELGGQGGARAVFIVDGLNCKGTARELTDMYEDVQGIASITTYASEHQAVFVYDPEVLTREKIQAVMEAPADGGEPLFRVRP